MTPKQKRERLFKSGRTHFRPLQIFDGVKYHKDIGILWVAHTRRPFFAIDKGVTQEAFAQEIIKLSRINEFLMAEDVNPQYKNSGPIAFVGIKTDGWKIEPHAEFFPWATNRNVLRATVAFMQMVRCRRQVGVCVVYGLCDSKALFDKCCEYGALHSVGTIPSGDRRGDEFIYYVRGKK